MFLYLQSIFVFKYTTGDSCVFFLILSLVGLGILRGVDGFLYNLILSLLTTAVNSLLHWL